MSNKPSGLFRQRVTVCCAHNLFADGEQIPHLQPEQCFCPRTRRGQNGYFTVNIPYGALDNQILGYCGKHSGCDTDKIRDLALTAVDSDCINVPGLKELPLTLECKVIYTQKQDASAIAPALLDRFYPAETDGKPDLHTAFYGEIVNAYLIEA